MQQSCHPAPVLAEFSGSQEAERMDAISIPAADVGCDHADMGLYAAEKLGMPASSPLSPQTSIEGMLKVINGLSQKDNGRFFDYEGKFMDY